MKIEGTEITQIFLTESDLPVKPVVLRDNRGRMRWKLPGNTFEQNIQLAIGNLQYLFLERFPEFDSLFPRDPEGKVADDRREDAKRFVLERVGHQKRLREVFGHGGTNKQYYPYFEGSQAVLISTVFQPWGLEFNTSKVDKQTGRFTDETGSTWAPANFFRTTYGIENRTLQKRIKNVSSIEGYDQTGSATKLYKEEEILPQIQGFLSLPRVNTDEGTLVDENGETWAPANHFRKKFDADKTVVNECIKGVRLIKGRDMGGKEVVLYCEAEVSPEVLHFMSLPQIDTTTQKYTDQEGRTWVLFTSIRKKYKGNTTQMPSSLNGVPTLPGRDRGGRKAVLYLETEVANIFRGKEKTSLEEVVISPDEANEQLAKLMEEI